MYDCCVYKKEKKNLRKIKQNINNKIIKEKDEENEEHQAVCKPTEKQKPLVIFLKCNSEIHIPI